jgi:hypothetical protein
MDFIFLGAASTNGYDALGHFLRSEALAATCVTYTVTPAPGCGSEKFFNTPGTSESSSSKGTAASLASAPIPAGTSLVMARTLAVLKGATPAQALARYPGSAPTPAEITGARPSSSPAAGAPVGGSSAGTTYYTPSAEEPAADGMLLNYLLGN